MVTVGVKHFLEIPSDDSLTQPALEELSSTTNSPRQPALEELSSTTNSPRPLTQPALEELSSTTNSPRPLTQPALEELPGTTNRSEPDLEIQEGTTDNEQLLGAPDLTVQLVKDPHIYLVIGEMKKRLTRMEKIRVKGWRARSNTEIGGQTVRNSQIGQLLFYLLTLQLKRIKHYIDPSLREHNNSQPNKALGVYSEAGRVCFPFSISCCIYIQTV
jgi:hypothetical protein